MDNGTGHARRTGCASDGVPSPVVRMPSGPPMPSSPPVSQSWGSALVAEGRGGSDGVPTEPRRSTESFRDCGVAFIVTELLCFLDRDGRDAMGWTWACGALGPSFVFVGAESTLRRNVECLVPAGRASRIAVPVTCRDRAPSKRPLAPGIPSCPTVVLDAPIYPLRDGGRSAGREGMGGGLALAALSGDGEPKVLSRSSNDGNRSSADIPSCDGDGALTFCLHDCEGGGIGDRFED